MCISLRGSLNVILSSTWAMFGGSCLGWWCCHTKHYFACVTPKNILHVYMFVVCINLRGSLNVTLNTYSVCVHMLRLMIGHLYIHALRRTYTRVSTCLHTHVSINVVCYARCKQAVIPTIHNAMHAYTCDSHSSI